MCKSIVEHLLRVTCPNRAGRQSRVLWAGGVPAEVAQPAPTLEHLSAYAATGWASVQPRAGESLFLPAQDPRQAMALLADPGKVRCP